MCQRPHIHSVSLDIRARSDRVDIVLRGAAPRPVRTPAGLARDLPRCIRERLQTAVDDGRSPGRGLYGDLLGGGLAEALEPLIDWARAAPARVLRIVLRSSDPGPATWPLELLTHPDHGVLGARSWCQVVRDIPPPRRNRAVFLCASDPARQRAARLALHRAVAKLRYTAATTLRRWALRSAAQGRWEDAAALYGSLVHLLPRGHEEGADIAIEHAEALAWTRGLLAAAECARQAYWTSRRRVGPAAWRAARFLADAHARMSDLDAAEHWLGRCLGLALRNGDIQGEADARVAAVVLRFEQHRDRDAVRAAPRARRACRRAARRDLEGRLDVALAEGAERHGHARAARRLLARGIRNLAATGQPDRAAGASSRLALLSLRTRAEEESIGAVAATLSLALQSPADTAPGLVLEGCFWPLFDTVVPELFRRGRPDLVADLGWTLLCLTAPPDLVAERHSHTGTLSLLVAWVGRFLRVVGWVAQEGVVTEEGETRLVAGRLMRRARRLARSLEELADGGLGAMRLVDLAVRVAEMLPRERGVPPDNPPPSHGEKKN